MELIAFKPPPGAWLGLDTVAVLSDNQLEAFYADGYRVIFGYSRRDGTVLDNPIPGGEYGDAVANGCNSLAISTSRRYMEHGFALSLVQFGTFGSAAHGQRMGAAAAASRRLLGFPPHTHFADVEGEAPQQAGPDRVRGYVEAWAGAYNAHLDNDLAGMYYNFRCMTPRALYSLRGITCYWMAAGPVPYSPHLRGESVRQRRPSTHYGVQIDRDIIRTDNLGDGPTLVGTRDMMVNWYSEAMAAASLSMTSQLPQ